MSPRPEKPRSCAGPFKGRAFKPTGIPMTKIEKIPIRRDELEALRLCDKEGLTQEEAGEKMKVSRGTVQRILSSARKKSAIALTECKALILEKAVCKEEK